MNIALNNITVCKMHFVSAKKYIWWEFMVVLSSGFLRKFLADVSMAQLFSQRSYLYFARKKVVFLFLERESGDQ